MPLVASIFIKISILEVHSHLLESVAVHFKDLRHIQTDYLELTPRLD